MEARLGSLSLSTEEEGLRLETSDENNQARTWDLCLVGRFLITDYSSLITGFQKSFIVFFDSVEVPLLLLL